MSWFLLRTDQGGGYVAHPGSHRTYVHDIAEAQPFSSKEAAEAEACPDNEVAVYI